MFFEFLLFEKKSISARPNLPKGEDVWTFMVAFGETPRMSGLNSGV